jgi:hypothetical protein
MSAKFYLLNLFFSLLFISNVYPQGKLRTSKNYLKHEKLTLLANLGLTTYYGDLCDKFECMQFRPSLGIGATYRFTNHLSNKTEINYYRIYSKDVHEVRNLNFRSGNMEFYTSAMFDLFAYTKHWRKRKFIAPYVFLGLGITYFNPKGYDENTGTWVALRPLHTEGKSYSPIAVIIPYGGGCNIRWQRDKSFILEIAYRKTFTDYLDDVSSKNYKSTDDFTDPIAAELSLKSKDPIYRDSYLTQQRGNPVKKDGYFIVNVKFRYVLGAKHSHFKGKHPLLKPHHKS